MFDTQRIESRFAELRKRLLILEKYFKILPEKKLLEDENLYAAAERNLEVAIQCCLDIANCLVTQLGLEVPKKRNVEVFQSLVQEKIISEELALKMQQAVGFRNILVHEYLRIQKKKTYENIQNGLNDFSQFAQAIEKFLEKTNKT